MPTPEELARQNIDATITPHNGQVSATICLIPDQDGAHCQGHGLVIRLTAAAYADVQFCDTTNNVCVNLENLP